VRKTLSSRHREGSEEKFWPSVAGMRRHAAGGNSITWPTSQRVVHNKPGKRHSRAST